MLLDENVVEKHSYKTFEFPLTFKFKIGTLANDFIATDANENTLAYVRQKMFKFKEAVKVYNNDSKSNVLYTINANKVIDWSASYFFTNSEGSQIGHVGRKGFKSLWKAHYEIFDENGTSDFIIQEENPMAKVFDALLSEIPLLGIFTGLLFNPRYGVKNNQGETVVRLSKKASFFGRKFEVQKLGDLNLGDDERILLSSMMMSLLERRRG